MAKETRKYRDRAKYMIEAVAKRRRRVKEMAVSLKGGKCQICGYDRYQGALDLHHVRGVKEFGIGDKGYTRSWEKVKAEIEKCMLVCANCHREIGGGFIKVSEKQASKWYNSSVPLYSSVAQR